MRPPIWFVPVVLLALGRKFRNKPRPFTVAELLAWAPELGKDSTVRFACQTLQRSGLLERAPDAVPAGSERRPANPSTWRLTHEGLAACRAAVQEAAQQARSATVRANNRQRIGSTLYGRLWNLLRNRKHLTSDEAVATLVDAGAATRRMQVRIAGFLSAWHAAFPEHIQLSARRVNGFKRYVVVKDPGPMPPPKAAPQEAAAR